MAACEGALLVVDATQGVEAQTIANAYLALENNLTIIPVINKIDIAFADPARTAAEIENTIGIDCSNAIHISAKTGVGVAEVLEAIVHRIVPPRGDLHKPLRCLVFDTYFDKFRGIVSFIRVVDGQVMPCINFILFIGFYSVVLINYEIKYDINNTDPPRRSSYVYGE